MHDSASKSVFILSPPFYSHFRPLLALARSLADLGAEVSVGCSDEFRDEIADAGLTFVPVRINRNANRGTASRTTQPDDERRRLDEFLRATSRGPVETLITQSRHRALDMLANPQDLIDRIREISEDLKPDLWIVDQLSYGATLALHGLKLRYVTFCAPHPATIPVAGATYGVPPRWPGALTPAAADHERLLGVAREVEESFTARFNEVLSTNFNTVPVESAFRLHSPHAVIYNYPGFSPTRKTGSALPVYAGHSVQPERLGSAWRRVAESARFLVVLAFGTFLGSRGDVLDRMIHGLKAALPDATIVVGAGESAELIRRSHGPEVIAESFIPQSGLLEHAGLAVHHGGVSSFTEALFWSTPMIVAPFSSDQFSVAYDVEDQRLGSVVDPNRLTTSDVSSAVHVALDSTARREVDRWSSWLRRRGPAHAANAILTLGEN